MTGKQSDAIGLVLIITVVFFVIFILGMFLYELHCDDIRDMGILSGEIKLDSMTDKELYELTKSTSRADEVCREELKRRRISKNK